MTTGDWKLWACSEYCGVMPDGKVKPADAAEPHWRIDAGGRIELPAPRNGWVSLRIVVEGRGEFAVRCELDTNEIACDLFREFYHRMTGDQPLWLADALVPLDDGETLAIPAADNDCPSQTAQSVWVDLEVLVDGESLVGDVARIKDQVERAVSKKIGRPASIVVYLKPITA